MIDDDVGFVYAQFKQIHSQNFYTDVAKIYGLRVWNEQLQPKMRISIFARYKLAHQRQTDNMANLSFAFKLESYL